MLYFFDIVLSHRAELFDIKRDILYQHPVHIVKGHVGASLNCTKVILVIDDIYTTGADIVKAE